MSEERINNCTDGREAKLPSDKGNYSVHVEYENGFADAHFDTFDKAVERFTSIVTKQWHEVFCKSVRVRSNIRRIDVMIFDRRGVACIG